MGNTVNYPLRTTPEIRAAAEVLTNLYVIEDEGHLMLDANSINSVLNSLMVLGMLRLKSTIECKITFESDLLRSMEGVMRYFMDSPQVKAVRPQDFNHESLERRVLDYIGWVQSPMEGKKDHPDELPDELQTILVSRVSGMCSFDGTDKIDRKLVTALLSDGQSELYWLKEAREHLATAVEKASAPFFSVE